MKNNIIIFGSNGFVGSALAESMKDDFDLKCIIRNKNSCSFISNLGIQPIICNTLDYQETLNNIHEGSIVINCVNGDYTTLVDSTKNIANACIEKKAKKLIHLSSTDVYGNSKGVINEDSDMVGNRGEYSKAKIEGSTLWTNRIIERKLNGFNLPEKAKKILCNLTYISDLILSIKRAINYNNQNITCNIISDDKIVWEEYYNAYKIEGFNSKINFKGNAHLKFIVLMQAPIRFIAKPILKYLRFFVNIMYQKNKYSNTLLRSTQSNLKANPDVNELSLLTTDVSYSNIKSKKYLKVEYTSFGKGLKETELWIKQINLVQAQYQL